MALDRSNIRLMTSTARVKSWLMDQSDKELLWYMLYWANLD